MEVSAIISMKNDITYYVALPTLGKQFPQEPPKSELERILQDSFASEGRKVLDGYFIEGNPLYPANLSFFVFPYVKKDDAKIWIASLIATTEVVEGFTFTYVDKAGVLPEWQGNGVGSGMIGVARMVQCGKSVYPVVLRTSIPKAHESYKKRSDICKATGEFNVHGYGFLNKETGEELFKDAEHKFDLAAGYIASKPRTVVPI